MNQISALLERIKSFADERDWQQFHSPKNISMALSVEASELLEHFQWMTEEESRNVSAEKKSQIADETADVFLYLLRICEQMDIDLLTVANKKIDKNALKYPVDKAKGNSKKYTEL
jgi:NTP pyrophosphatase (non-canonical NTP hydrolase)